MIPLVSIIVPVYNVEKYIRRCLDSIKDQTFKDFECILIDDGSPDNCPVICDEYAKIDSRFIVIHQKNAGVSAARNAGLDAAKGEWVCFVDSDDWVEENYLQELENKNEGNCDLVFFNIVDEFKNYSKNIYEPVDENLIPHNFIPKYLTQEYRGGPWSFFAKNSLIKKIRFDKEIFFWEDFLFKIQLLCKSVGGGYIDKYLYHYYCFNECSVCQKIDSSKSMSMLEAVNKVKEILHNEKLYDKYKYWMDYRILWTKLFYIKSLPKRKRNWKIIFDDSEIQNIRLYEDKFNKSMKILLKFISKKMFYFADLFIDINNFIKGSYKK